MNRIRMWPHGALIILAFAAIGAVGALLWSRYERRAEASTLPNAARIERVEGQVGVSQSAENSTNSEWVAATPNMPVSVGDRIYSKQNSKTQIGFTGRNIATMDANTSLDVLDLSEGRTQVALREGSTLFDVGSISSGNLFEVATPCGAVDLQQPGLYQVVINENGNAVATVFSGQAQVVGQGGSGQIEKGEYLSVACQGGGQATISRVEPNQAGYQVDNYYRARYPKHYDGRYRNYYTYLDDPYYYDPGRLYPSYNYVSDYVPGIDDLDDYGDWRYVSDYGNVWHPRVDAGWAPYESGYWTMDNPYGLTWVSSEPWGYAPYHYGRWAYASNDWVWVPNSIQTYPTYSPALVAFIPLGKSSVAWVALGPNDPYQTTYYDQSWQPVYTYPSNVVVDRLVNINVPGAVTVVPTYDFGHVIDPGVITRVDPRTITTVQPVLNPLAVDPLRSVAFQTRQARQRFDLPRQIEQRIANTPVVASTAPVAPRFRGDLARAMKVEPVSAQAKRQKLQVSDQRTAATQTAPPANIAAEQARERQMADLAKQAARGDRGARQQLQDLRKQQLAERDAQRAATQTQGQQVGQPMRPQDQRQMERQQQQAQREAARQQMMQSQQQQRAAAQQQAQTLRDQRRNQVQQAQTQRRAQQQQMLKTPPPNRRPPQAAPQAQAQPQRVQSVPRAAPQMTRPPQVQSKPQAQPRAQPAQPVRPPQANAKPQAQPKAQPPGQAKPPGKKKP
ncbi:MAG TPA: DUF6600 domain-containing protein [Candidatus Binatia bacterium]|nr:DUF6600 domain-containing protein [Candidatus Binatia bacterium]